MLLVRMRSLTDYETEKMAAGHHYVKAELSELVFFIRKGKVIPVGKSAGCTKALDRTALTLMGYEGAEYELYEDDGNTCFPDLEKGITVIRN
jgi:alpha-glucosidase